MNVQFSMGLHKAQPHPQHPGSGGYQVLLVGSVRTMPEALELQQWIMAALREKAGAVAVSKGGIILPTTMKDAEEIK